MHDTLTTKTNKKYTHCYILFIYKIINCYFCVLNISIGLRKKKTGNTYEKPTFLTPSPLSHLLILPPLSHTHPEEMRATKTHITHGK